MKIKNIAILFLTIILGLGVLGYLLIKLILPDHTITSWWRTPFHNEEVGGVINSMHLIGMGYDVSPKPTDEEVSKFWWFRTKIKSYPKHIHFGWWG